MFKLISVFCAFALMFAAAPAFAEEELTPAEKAEIARLRGILEAQKPITGSVPLPVAHVTLNLGERYYFLGPEDTKVVLKEWGNPPSVAEGALGMVFPAGKIFLDDTWGAIVTYVPDGHIPDDDADKADYDALLKELQSGEPADNEARKKDGFPTATTLGWAQPPSYDKARHHLIWAREIQFGDEADHTLNYDVRMLGRHGYLSVNLISNMTKLPQIRTDALQLAQAATFDTGARYADFDAATDKKAEYGLAGLVAAGLGLGAAKKLGLLAVIGVFAKKLWVLIFAFGAAAMAWVRKLFGVKPKTPDGSE